MKKIPEEYLNVERIDEFIEENKDKKLYELFEVKEDYDIGDYESRSVEYLDLHVRIYNFLKRIHRNGIGKGYDINENLLSVKLDEFKLKHWGFIGKKGKVILLETLNDFLKDK